jgi:hypothetical protein
VRKAIAAPTFVFKGSGWAKLDRRERAKPAASTTASASGESAPSTAPTSESSSDSGATPSKPSGDAGSTPAAAASD